MLQIHAQRKVLTGTLLQIQKGSLRFQGDIAPGPEEMPGFDRDLAPSLVWLALVCQIKQQPTKPIDAPNPWEMQGFDRDLAPNPWETQGFDRDLAPEPQEMPGFHRDLARSLVCLALVC